ncbi:sugar phosphate isomerase/epimerase [Hydrotalea sp.]|uniref:sugar phosphate isomerase/epimerase family protein n=1 Tax=Hydrotalea sp. TaxID=2881279 RepID=UPI002590E22A|nr:sugar phosphate isomerase/epimerase [Hydrotalea sp.]
MSTNRRNFLKMGGLSALALAAPVKKMATNILTDVSNHTEGDLSKFGLQLWTVKEDLAKDPKQTLKAVASYGYKQLESFEGKMGIFWGMTNKEFKKYCDSVGTKIISSHCDINTNFEQKAAEAAEIGMDYLICPYKGPQKDIDSFKKIAEQFNQCGEICKKNGIKFAYHNHDYSFKPVDGQVPQVVMMDETDPHLVDFEMDIYWVVAAGENSQEWLKKYSHRFRLCHVKDLAKTANGGHESCILGKGTIDYPAILKTARENGMKYYIVEQEAFTGTTPLLSAKADAAYMKAFKFA